MCEVEESSDLFFEVIGNLDLIGSVFERLEQIGCEELEVVGPRRGLGNKGHGNNHVNGNGLLSTALGAASSDESFSLREIFGRGYLSSDQWSLAFADNFFSLILRTRWLGMVFELTQRRAVAYFDVVSKCILSRGARQHAELMPLCLLLIDLKHPVGMQGMRRLDMSGYEEYVSRAGDYTLTARCERPFGGDACLELGILPSEVSGIGDWLKLVNGQHTGFIGDIRVSGCRGCAEKVHRCYYTILVVVKTGAYGSGKGLVAGTIPSQLWYSWCYLGREILHRFKSIRTPSSCYLHTLCSDYFGVEEIEPWNFGPVITDDKVLCFSTSLPLCAPCHGFYRSNTLYVDGIADNSYADVRSVYRPPYLFMYGDEKVWLS